MMKINANQTFKSGRFSGELKHVDRTMPNDSNAESINRKLSKYNIGKTLLDVHKLVRQHYLPFVRKHDLKCEQKHRYSREYGSVANFWKHKKKYSPTDIGISTVGTMKDKDKFITRFGKEAYVKNMSRGLANYMDGWNARNPYIPVYVYKTNVDERGAGHVHFGVVCQGSSVKTGKPSASLTPAVIAEHGRPLDDYKQSHPDWFKWSKSYKMVRGSDGKKHRKFKGYKQRNLWKARRQQRKDAFSRFDDVEARELLRCVGKHLHLDLNYQPTHQHGSVDMQDYKHTKSVEDRFLISPAIRQSSEADQLKLRTMSQSASVARSASQLGGSLSQQVAKVKANLASTSDYFSHASSVASSADELAPRFKHHYSQSASKSGSVVNSSKQAQLSQSVSNHVMLLDNSIAADNYYNLGRMARMSARTSSKAKSKADELIASASSLAPSLSASAFDYGSRMSSIADSSASVVVTHEYSSANDVVNSYYDSYEKDKSNVHQSYSVSAQNYVSSTISSERGQLSQSVSNHVQSVDKSMADNNARSIAGIRGMSKETSSLEVSASSLAPSLSASAESYGKSVGDSYFDSYNSAYAFFTSSVGESYSLSAQSSASSNVSVERVQLSQSASNMVASFSSAYSVSNSTLNSKSSAVASFRSEVRKPVIHFLFDIGNNADAPKQKKLFSKQHTLIADQLNDKDLLTSMQNCLQRTTSVIRRYTRKLKLAVKRVFGVKDDTFANYLVDNFDGYPEQAIDKQLKQNAKTYDGQQRNDQFINGGRGPKGPHGLNDDGGPER